MAFLFADPIVIQLNNGAIIDYDIRLDLDAEFDEIVNSLKLVGKSFSLKREAISLDSLKKVIT